MCMFATSDSIKLILLGSFSRGGGARNIGDTPSRDGDRYVAAVADPMRQKMAKFIYPYCIQRPDRG